MQSLSPRKVKFHVEITVLVAGADSIEVSDQLLGIYVLQSTCFDLRDGFVV